MKDGFARIQCKGLNRQERMFPQKGGRPLPAFVIRRRDRKSRDSTAFLPPLLLDVWPTVLCLLV
jgi:hypothetical protein